MHFVPIRRRELVPDPIQESGVVMKITKILFTLLPFPKPVGAYLVKRYPGSVIDLVQNQNIDPTAFNGVSAAKEKADSAEALVTIDNPSIISEWCSSRDKRQGVTDSVLRYWHLPIKDQIAFASKALTPDSARQVLRSDWFCDQAKLVAAPRAGHAAMWEWLEREPTGLSDDQWIAAVSQSSAKGGLATQSFAPYATVNQRTHLAQRLIEGDLDDAAMLACSLVPWIDPDVALDRVAACGDITLQRVGLSNLLDHPSLPDQARVRGFALARELKMLNEMYRLGCPSPGSPVALGIPLAEITDPLQLELITMRSVATSAPRIYQFIQAAASPVAGSSLLARLQHEAPRSALNGSVFAARMLKMLSERSGMTHQASNEELDRLSQRVASQQAMVGLTVPSRHGTPRRFYGNHYVGSDTNSPIPSAEQLLQSPLDEISAMIVGYRVHPRAHEIFTEALTEALGDGSDDASLSRWERFFELIPRTNASIRIGQVITTAVKLG